jgi:hypothetical protein
MISIYINILWAVKLFFAGFRITNKAKALGQDQSTGIACWPGAGIVAEVAVSSDMIWIGKFFFFLISPES